MLSCPGHLKERQARDAEAPVVIVLQVSSDPEGTLPAIKESFREYDRALGFTVPAIVIVDSDITDNARAHRHNRP